MLIDPESAQAIAAILSIPVISSGVSKVVETIAEQMALFAEPSHIRRRRSAEAESDADAKVTKAVGDERVKIVKLEGKLFIENRKERALERVARLADRRQENMESIAKNAAKEVANSVSPEPVDRDWLSQFFEYCGDVSNADMQILWGKLLVREVEQPGLFSLRTLATVKLMSRKEAELFTRLCVTAWTDIETQNPHILFPSLGAEALRIRIDLSYPDLLRFEAMGLIKTFVGIEPSLMLDSDQLRLRYGSSTYVVSRSPKYWKREATPYLGSDVDHARKFDLGPIVLTDVGAELSRIAGAIPNQGYLQWIRERYEADHWTFTLEQ